MQSDSLTFAPSGIDFEPFKIKSIEPLNITTREYRGEALKKAHYNPFLLKSKDVLIDLLTDSGTSAMSNQQWAGIFKGEEVYIGSGSFEKFQSAIQEFTGYPEVIPAHQGRAAERCLFQALELKKFNVVIANGFFDTTRCNLEAIGITPVEYPEGKTEHPSHFRGNIDIEKLKAHIQGPEVYKVGLVIMCITNSHLSGQPVSMKNLTKVSQLCKNHKVPFYLDACRYAENFYYVKRLEDGYHNKSIPEIAREVFALSDGCYVSMKKDGLCNTGGFIALKDQTIARKCRENVILSEGFPNYGGLTGRDLECMALGIAESINEDFLNYHIGMVESFGTLLYKMGIPVVLPTAGYAVYINASDMLPGIKVEEHPAWSLVCALYHEGGIRACELGNIMRVPDETEQRPELIRFAIPRRLYTYAHLQFVADTLKYIMDHRDRYGGYEIVEENEVLRHFSIKLKPIPKNDGAVSKNKTRLLSPNHSSTEKVSVKTGKSDDIDNYFNNPNVKHEQSGADRSNVVIPAN